MLHQRKLQLLLRMIVSRSSVNIAANGFRLRIRFLLVQVMHLSVNTQKMERSWCYSVVGAHTDQATGYVSAYIFFVCVIAGEESSSPNVFSILSLFKIFLRRLFTHSSIHRRGGDFASFCGTK